MHELTYRHARRDKKVSNSKDGCGKTKLQGNEQLQVPIRPSRMRNKGDHAAL